MNHTARTRSPLRTPGWIAGLGLAAFLVTGQAWAGCMSSPSAVAAAAAPGKFAPALYHPAAGVFLRTSYESPQDGEWGHAAIVGLWKFQMKVDGNPFDFGLVIWHDDGTEVTLSGGRNPTIGDVCMGAWQQVGRSKFTLNHLGLAWAGGAYLGVAHIRQLVTVDPTGNSFSGTFTIEQYADSTADPFDESTPPIATISGSITGTRVTAH